jgi:hypothetical protein
VPTSCRPSSQLDEPSSDTKSAWITAHARHRPLRRCQQVEGSCGVDKQQQLQNTLTRQPDDSTGSILCILCDILWAESWVQVCHGTAPDIVRMMADSGSRSSVKECPVAQPTRTTVGSTKSAICSADCQSAITHTNSCQACILCTGLSTAHRMVPLCKHRLDVSRRAACDATW